MVVYVHTSRRWRNQKVSLRREDGLRDGPNNVWSFVSSELLHGGRSESFDVESSAEHWSDSFSAGLSILFHS